MKMIHYLQATCKPMTESIQERVKALQDSSVSDSIVLRIFASIGLSSHGILFAILKYFHLSTTLLFCGVGIAFEVRGC